jgi:hypothetical protein
MRPILVKSIARPQKQRRTTAKPTSSVAGITAEKGGIIM